VFFLVLPAVLMFLLAGILSHAVNRTLDDRAQRLAKTSLAVSGAAALSGLMIAIMTPSLMHNRRFSNSSVCAANLKGIVQSMNVYGNDNADAYPLVQYAPYALDTTHPRGNAASTTVGDVYRRYYGPDRLQAGNVQAALWILVLRGDVSPKSFICKDDPFAERYASVTNAADAYYDNFQKSRQISYSLSYPWAADGTVGAWWKASIDASLPMMSDMAPLQGTGRPAVNVTAKPLDQAANSRNHKRDGQNVAFGDNHVEFTRLPNCGQDNDNIFTISADPGTGPSQYGIPAGTAAPQLTAKAPPFDVVMLPARNETTGEY